MSRAYQEQANSQLDTRRLDFSDLNMPQYKPPEEVGYLKSAGQNFLAGLENSIGGTLNFIGANMASGSPNYDAQPGFMMGKYSDTGREFGKSMMNNGEYLMNDAEERLQQYGAAGMNWGTTQEALTNPNYWFNPRGLTADLFNGTGSSVPELLAGLATGGLGSLAARGALGAVAKTMTKEELAAAFLGGGPKSKALPYIAGFGLGGAATEAPSDAGSNYADILAKVQSELNPDETPKYPGESAQQEAVRRMNLLAAEEIPALAASNAITGALIGGKVAGALGKNSKDMGARFMANMLAAGADMTGEGLTEVAQTSFANDMMYKPRGDILNPSTWDADQHESFRAGFVGAALPAAHGVARGTLFPGDESQDKPRNSNIQPHNNLFGAGTASYTTQGEDIDKQVEALKPGWSGVIPQIFGVIENSFGIKGAQISSAGRTRAHNAEVGGAENSYHISDEGGGDALDIVLPDNVTEEQANQIKAEFEATGAFNEVLFHDAGSGYHLHLGGLKTDSIGDSYGTYSGDSNIDSMINEVAEQYGIEPSLLAAIADQESGFSQDANSGAGAIGIMQLMPETAEGLGVDPNDLRGNLEGGAKYLRQMLDKYNGDVEKALAAYNAGPGSLDSVNGDISQLSDETKNYVPSVLDKYNKYKTQSPRTFSSNGNVLNWDSVDDDYKALDFFPDEGEQPQGTANEFLENMAKLSESEDAKEQEQGQKALDLLQEYGEGPEKLTQEAEKLGYRQTVDPSEVHSRVPMKPIVQRSLQNGEVTFATQKAADIFATTDVGQTMQRDGKTFKVTDDFAKNQQVQAIQSSPGMNFGSNATSPTVQNGTKADNASNAKPQPVQDSNVNKMLNSYEVGLLNTILPTMPKEAQARLTELINKGQYDDVRSMIRSFSREPAYDLKAQDAIEAKTMLDAMLNTPEALTSKTGTRINLAQVEEYRRTNNLNAMNRVLHAMANNLRDHGMDPHKVMQAYLDSITNPSVPQPTGMNNARVDAAYDEINNRLPQDDTAGEVSQGNGRNANNGEYGDYGIHIPATTQEANQDANSEANDMYAKINGSLPQDDTSSEVSRGNTNSNNSEYGDYGISIPSDFKEKAFLATLSEEERAFIEFMNEVFKDTGRGIDAILDYAYKHLKAVKDGKEKGSQEAIQDAIKGIKRIYEKAKEFEQLRNERLQNEQAGISGGKTQTGTPTGNKTISQEQRTRLEKLARKIIQEKNQGRATESKPNTKEESTNTGSADNSANAQAAAFPENGTTDTRIKAFLNTLGSAFTRNNHGMTLRGKAQYNGKAMNKAGRIEALMRDGGRVEERNGKFFAVAPNGSEIQVTKGEHNYYEWLKKNGFGQQRKAEPAKAAEPNTSPMLAESNFRDFKHTDSKAELEQERAANQNQGNKKATAEGGEQIGKALSSEENISNGLKALDNIIENHEDVHGAMNVEGIGPIDLIWGVPGRGSKFKHGFGICHIIAKRNSDYEKGRSSVDGITTAKKLIEVIAKGKKKDIQFADNSDEARMRIHYDGYTAILSMPKDGNNWLLTGWEDDRVENKKEASVNASDERDDSSAATADTTPFTRHTGETNAFVTSSVAEKQENSNENSAESEPENTGETAEKPKAKQDEDAGTDNAATETKPDDGHYGFFEGKSEKEQKRMETTLSKPISKNDSEFQPMSKKQRIELAVQSHGFKVIYDGKDYHLVTPEVGRDYDVKITATEAKYYQYLTENGLSDAIRRNSSQKNEKRDAKANADDKSDSGMARKRAQTIIGMIKQAGIKVVTDTAKMKEVLGTSLKNAYKDSIIQKLIISYKEGEKAPDLTLTEQTINGKKMWGVAFVGEKPKNYIPKKIGKAYKLMEMWPDGSLHALFAGTDKSYKIGEWNWAQGFTPDEAGGIKTMKLAPRYGWHMGTGVPATHHLMGIAGADGKGSTLNPKIGYPSKSGVGHPKGSKRVWVEVHYDATNDYSDIAESNPGDEKDIRGLIPFGGYYMFQESNLSNWIIASSIKFDHVLSENERQNILDKAGYDEELMWRTYVVPKMLNKQLNPLKAAVATGWKCKNSGKATKADKEKAKEIMSGPDAPPKYAGWIPVSKLSESELEKAKKKLAQYQAVYDDNQKMISQKTGGKDFGYKTLSEEEAAAERQRIRKAVFDNPEWKANEESLQNGDEVQYFTTDEGEVFGFVKDGVIYLDPNKMNTNTPIHEYTHVWDNVIRDANPELWERGKQLMKQTPVWNEVINNPAYADIAHDEDLVASEVHARLTGEKGELLIESLSKNEPTSLVEKLKAWAKEYWGALKDHFTKWGVDEASEVSLDEFISMPIADLANGVNIGKIATKRANGQSYTQGHKTTVYTRDGKEYNVHYEVRPESEIVASNTSNGSTNENYPKELQPRNRKRTGNMTQVHNIVNHLKPSLLTSNTMLNLGAPLIRQDGAVLNGNGRMMAIRTAVKNGTDSNYKDYLVKNAEKFGLDPAEIKAMENPVLVKVMDDELTAKDVDSIINDTSGGQRMSASEQAKADAKKIKSSTLAMYQPNEKGELTGRNTNFLATLLGEILPSDELNAYYGENGGITKDGIERARRALFALAYGDDHLLDAFAEDSSEQAKNFINALNTNAPYIAKLQRMIENGNGYDLKLRNSLVSAINELRESIIAGTPAERIWRETSMFKEAELSPEVKTMAKIMDSFRRSGKKLTNFIGHMVESGFRHGNPKQLALFEGGNNHSLMEDINYAKEMVENGGQPSLFEDVTENPVNKHSADYLKENGNTDTELDRLPKIPMDKLRKGEQKLVKFGTAIGVKVHFVESSDKGNRGVFTHNGEIYINRNAAVPVKAIFVHEFVHWLKASPENAGAYDVLHACLENLSGIVNQERIDKYRKRIFDGENMTDEEIAEEIICDAMTNSESAAKLMRAINNIDASLATKIGSYLKAMWDKFCKAIGFNPKKLSREQTLSNELSVSEMQKADAAFNKILMELKDENGKPVFKRVGTELFLASNNSKPSESHAINPIGYTYTKESAYSQGNESTKQSTLAVSTDKVQNMDKPIKATMDEFVKTYPDGITVSTSIGDVRITKKSIKNSLSHGCSPKKLAVIPTLKDGIENNTPIRIINDYDNAQKTNYFFVYPVQVDGEENFVLCRVVGQGDLKNLYVHEVANRNEITKKSDSLQTRAVATESNPTPRGVALYTSILQDYIENSKQNSSKHSQQSAFSNGNNHKQEQFDILQKKNPMTDDYHVGIRSVDDILTAEEAFNVSDPDEAFVYPDFTEDDAQEALASGKVKVYSSHPINQGVFVSPSKAMAEDYAGGGKIYSAEISLNDVAWINDSEGMIAKTNTPNGKAKRSRSRDVGISPSTDGVAMAANANNNLLNSMRGIVNKLNPLHHNELENLRIDRKVDESDLSGIEFTFTSAARLAKKYKAVEPFFNMAKQAVTKQEQLRFYFNSKMNEIDETLGWSKLKNDPKFKERKEQLQKILFDGDVEGREYTNAELAKDGYSPEVIKAYRQMRSLLDYAWKIANDTKGRIKYHSLACRSEAIANAEFADIKAKNPFAEVISKVKNADGTVTLNYKEPHIYHVAARNMTVEELETLKQDKDVHIQSVKQSAIEGNVVVTYDQRNAGLGKRGGYVPHVFHGWYVCKVDKDGKPLLDADGNVDKDSIMVTADSMSEAVKLGEKLAKQDKNGNYVVTPQTFSAPGAQEQAVVMGDYDYAKVISKVANSMTMSIADAKAMMDGTVKMKNRGRFYGYAMQRKGFSGYEQNVYLATMKYFNQTARYVALDPFKRNAISMYNRNFGNIENDNVAKRSATARWIRKYIYDMNGYPTGVEEFCNKCLHALGLGKERAGGRPALWIQQNIFTYPMTIMKLGILNPASSILNLTQLFNLYGAMGEKVMSGEAYRRLLNNGFRDTFKAMSDKDSELGKLLWEDLGLNYQIGMDISAGYSNAEVSGLASLHGFTARMAGKSMYLFRQSDAFARGVTLLTAYNKALSEGKSKAEAIEYAKKINDKVNFDYSVADEPWIFRAFGPISKVLLQFKKYPVKQIELFHDFYLEGREAGLNKKQSALRMLKYMAPYMAMSGMMGIPFISLAGGLFSALMATATGDDDWDWEKKMKQYMIAEFGEDSPLTQWWLYGGGAMLGINVGSRIGVGDFMGSDSYNSADGVGGLLWNQTTLGSTINQVDRQLSYRNYAEAVKAINPTVGNILQAYKGEVRTTRGRMKYEYQNLGERIWRAIGFTPLNEAMAGDLASFEYAEKQEQTKAKEQAIDDFLAEPSSENAQRLNEVGVTPKTIKNEAARRTMNRHDLNELEKEKAEEKAKNKKQKKDKTYSAEDYLKGLK